MNVSRQRTLNILAGILFSMLGIACYGGAAYLVTVPPKPVMGPDSLKLDTQHCKQVLGRLGFRVREQGNELRVDKADGLADPHQLLSDASIGIGACGMPLTRFCMGSDCQPPAIPGGIFFGLSTQLSTEEVVAAMQAP